MVDSLKWAIKMQSEAIRLVHTGVNTDPFERQSCDDLSSRKSQSKLTVREDVVHVHINDSTILQDTYAFEESLGQGSFGKVVAICDKTNNQALAMKIIPKTLVPNKINAIRQEINILKVVKHPHIIHLHKVLESTKKIYLILEKCTGELGKLFRKTCPFSESDTKVIIVQLANVVDYLHKHDIVHRDLKLENILLAPNPDDPEDTLYIKVTDFGLGIIKGAYHEMLHDRCGTLTYLSPEIITKSGYSHQCDVWAMGVIMYLLLFAKFPFYAPVEQKLIKLICEGDPDLSHPYASDAAMHLISKMLTKDPALRITAAEVKRHAWIVGSPLSECKHDNVLEMMKLWRSDMMLPQGTDCDWVSTKLNVPIDSVAGYSKTKETDISQPQQQEPSRSGGRKQSLKLPIHNIEFDRFREKARQDTESSRNSRSSKTKDNLNVPIAKRPDENSRRTSECEPFLTRNRKTPRNSNND